MIKVPYTQNIADDYYTLIAQRKMPRYGNRTFESYYNQYIKKQKMDGIELRELLCGSYERLVEIKDTIGTKYRSKTNIIKQLFNYDKRKGKIVKFQPKISKYFEEKVEVHTCYYCNIEFINTFKKSNGKSKNGFTLDHYIDKATYPFLSLSLYNLIPSCNICNSKVKSIKEIKSISPSSEQFDFDDKVKFTTLVANSNLEIAYEKDIDLFLEEFFSEDYREYIDVLMLNERYAYHKYKVIELINKRKAYPDTRIRELAELTQKTEEEVKQDIFGEYIPNTLHKRPLSKLIKDISSELGLT